MEKQLKLAIGTAAVVGIGYYIYQMNKPKNILPFAGAGSFSYSQKIGSDGSMTVTPHFSNASGGNSCPVNATYTIYPPLPKGLSLNQSTGVISGTPVATQQTTLYNIRATNSGGSTVASWSLTVSAIPVPKLSPYSPASVVTTQNGVAVKATIVNGGAVAEFSISPALPSGITIDKNTGTISGVATTTSPLTVYTVTANSTISTGSATAKFTLTVNSPIPTGLSYTPTTVFVGGSVNTAPDCATATTVASVNDIASTDYSDGELELSADGTRSTNCVFSQSKSLYL